jgi:hypothetical protein
MRFSLSHTTSVYAAPNEAYFTFDAVPGAGLNSHLYVSWTQPLANLFVNASGQADWALSSQFGLMVMDTTTLSL